MRAAEIGDAEDVAGGIHRQTAERRSPIVAGQAGAEIIERLHVRLSGLTGEHIHGAAVQRPALAGGAVERRDTVIRLPERGACIGDAARGRKAGLAVAGAEGVQHGHLSLRRRFENRAVAASASLRCRAVQIAVSVTDQRKVRVAALFTGRATEIVQARINSIAALGIGREPEEHALALGAGFARAKQTSVARQNNAAGRVGAVGTAGLFARGMEHQIAVAGGSRCERKDRDPAGEQRQREIGRNLTIHASPPVHARRDCQLEQLTRDRSRLFRPRRARIERAAQTWRRPSV